MTKEEAIEILNHNVSACLHGTEWGEALEIAIEALEQKPCEDAINRQAVEDAIYDYSRSCDVNYAQIMEHIDKIPSVSTEKTGWWEKAKSEIRYGENKAYNADFTMGCEYAIGVIERVFEEVGERE